MRTETVHVSFMVKRDLDTIAFKLGLQSGDEVAELWLSERIKQEPGLVLLREIKAKHRKEAMREWEEKMKQPPDDIT